MKTFLLVVGIIFLFCSYSIYSQQKIKITVSVNSTKENGKSWDIGGGLPDIVIKIRGENIGSIESPRNENTLKTSYTFDLTEETESFDIEVWDKDITNHDLIGKCSDVSLKKQTLTCGNCKVSISLSN
jgi:hypothetical protein